MITGRQSRLSKASSPKRLQAITTDAAALDSFERVAQSGEMESEFLEAVARLNISLDHVFADRGEPFLSAEGMASA